MDSFKEIMKKRLTDFTELNNCISGYVEQVSYKNLMKELSASGYSYSVRKSSKNKSGDNYVFSYNAGKKEKSPSIDLGYPFQSLETSLLECSLGPHYYKREKETDESDHPSCKKKRFHINETKKMGCPAWMSVKRVKVFTEYVAKDKSWRSRKMVLDKLRTDCHSSAPPGGCIMYFIRGNTTHSHSKTVVGLNQTIHPDILKEIRRFVDSGTTSTRDIQIYLQSYTNNSFGVGHMPSPTNRAFYPSQAVIYRHIYQAIYDSKKTKIDQEALESALVTWQRQAPDHKFYFRPYTDEGTLLFVHQTSWQKHLLQRYGKICLLDATYKTTKYALPLFFLCVRTNVGYSVVATFVVQAETKVLVTEALQMIKDWCPKWNATYFMTDFSEVEISALEMAFPQVTVYLCAFHREQAWLRWLRKAGNLMNRSAEDVLTLWRNVANAECENEFNESIRKVEAGLSNEPKAQAYFSNQWLPHAHQWVANFSSKDFVTIINTNNGVEAQNKVLKHTYLSHSADKTLTGVLIVIIGQYLPDSLRKYAQKNSVTKVYNEEIPQYLLERPAPFIKHMLKRTESARCEIQKENIAEFGDGLLTVKSSSDPNTHYIVNFDLPNCSCLDFRRNRLPCKHICAVIDYFPGYIEKLPNEYMNSPYMTLDLELSLCIQKETVLQDSHHTVSHVSGVGEIVEEVPEMEEDAGEGKEDEVSEENALKQPLQELREELKQWLDMSYLFVDPNVRSAICSATEMLRAKRLEIVQLLPSSSGLPLLPSGSLNCQGSKNYKQLPLRKKRKPQGNVVKIE